MTETLDPLEQRLLAGYQQQAVQYERALRILDERAGAATDTIDDANWVAALQEVLHTVADLAKSELQGRTEWTAL